MLAEITVDTVVGVSMVALAVGVWAGRIIGIRKERDRLTRWAVGQGYRSTRDHVNITPPADHQSAHQQGAAIDVWQDGPRTDGAHWRL